MTGNRRTFLKSAAATVAATWVGTRSYGELPPAGKPHSIRWAARYSMPRRP